MALTTENRSRISLNDRAKLGSVVRATVDRSSACACGQALDPSRTSSCPRCGIRVVAKSSVRPLPRHVTFAEWST
jgi:hypothetical protein